MRFARLSFRLLVGLIIAMALILSLAAYSLWQSRKGEGMCSVVGKVEAALVAEAGDCGIPTLTFGRA